MSPSYQVDETWASSLISPVQSIVWKHDVIHKTGSTQHYYIFTIISCTVPSSLGRSRPNLDPWVYAYVSNFTWIGIGPVLLRIKAERHIYRIFKFITLWWQRLAVQRQSWTRLLNYKPSSIESWRRLILSSFVICILSNDIQHKWDTHTHLWKAYFVSRNSVC